MGCWQWIQIAWNLWGSRASETLLGSPIPSSLAKLTAKHSKGEKRPGNVIGAAVTVGKIATGEIDELTTEDGNNAAAVVLGRMGGKARAAGMSARRKEIAKKAAAKRWFQSSKASS
jgi:hypothetical protein